MLRALRRPRSRRDAGAGLLLRPAVHADRQHPVGSGCATTGCQLTAIGFLSWVGLAYSVKFLWAPLVDRLALPLIGGWAGGAAGCCSPRSLVGGGLIGMALTRPKARLAPLAAFAVAAAFASATQDIVVDAWRIEAPTDADELGLLTSAYQLGYRVALMATEALILLLAAAGRLDPSYVSWRR